MTKSDPGAFLRELLGQWEGFASQFGGEMAKSGDIARAASAGIKAKDAAAEVMTRALAAANMPSREEVVGLAERMRGVEERLGRIETLLIGIAGDAMSPASAPSKAARTKKSSKKDG